MEKLTTIVRRVYLNTQGYSTGRGDIPFAPKYFGVGEKVWWVRIEDEFGNVQHDTFVRASTKLVANDLAADFFCLKVFGRKPTKRGVGGPSRQRRSPRALSKT